MTADLLEALFALCTACSCEARRCHPHLFVYEDERHGSPSVTAEDQAVLLLTRSIDDLLDRLDDLLVVWEVPAREFDVPHGDDIPDDDIPF